MGMGNDCATGHACFRSTCSSVRCEARDAAWISRELGDVEYLVRTATIGGMKVTAVGAGPYTYTIPVESLGRECP